VKVYALRTVSVSSVPFTVVKQRSGHKGCMGYCPTLCGLSYLGFQKHFSPVHNKNYILCYAGPGAFTRRDDAPFSPPRPYWFDAKLGATAILSSIRTRREKESPSLVMNLN